jgi:hypothetical protein
LDKGNIFKIWGASIEEILEVFAAAFRATLDAKLKQLK